MHIYINVWMCWCDEKHSINFKANQKCIISRSLHTQLWTKEHKKEVEMKMKMQTWTAQWQLTIHQKYIFLFWICGRWPKLKCSLLMSLNLFLCLLAFKHRMSYIGYLKGIFASGLEKYVDFEMFVLLMLQPLWFEPVNFFYELCYCHSFNRT